MQLVSTVTSKGQVLIPMAIRKKLDVGPFDRIVFSTVESTIVAKKTPTTNEMYGFIKTRKRLTDKQLEGAINEAVEEGLARNL